MTEEQFDKLCGVFQLGFDVLNSNLQVLVETHQRVERHLQQLAIAANPAPNYQKPLADYWNFDWSLIGAVPQSFDQEGATSVEWNGRLFVRRSPQNKFQEAVWFSRAIGKDELGNNKYEKLITFKDSAEAEELGNKVKKAAPSPVETKRLPDSLQERAQAFVNQKQVKTFGNGTSRMWRVGAAGADVEVWRDEAGIRQCTCRELATLRRQDAKAECVHILAVALSVSGRVVATSHEQPVQ